jgi:nucleoside-diphosphate-sugar epimerase
MRGDGHTMQNIEDAPLAVVFGGSGFIGSHLCESLLSHGYKVIVADLLKSSNPNILYTHCDVRNEIQLPIEKVPELIFNLAAIHRTPGHEIDEYYETNVAGAINISQWCNKVGAKKIIFTSSISVYGPGSSLITEQSPLNPIHAYGRSKRLAEGILENWQSESPNERVLIISRPAVIFGPGEKGNFTRLARALKRKYFFYPGGSKTVKASGYVKDLVSSFDYVASQISQGIIIYNFCYPQNYTIGEICHAFNKVAKYSLPVSIPISSMGRMFVNWPGPFGTLGARLLKLVDSTNIAPKKLKDLGFTWNTEIVSALQDWKINSLSQHYFE